jgi:hypothetical protein
MFLLLNIESDVIPAPRSVAIKISNRTQKWIRVATIYRFYLVGASGRPVDSSYEHLYHSRHMVITSSIICMARCNPWRWLYVILGGRRQIRATRWRDWRTTRRRWRSGDHVEVENWRWVGDGGEGKRHFLVDRTNAEANGIPHTPHTSVPPRREPLIGSMCWACTPRNGDAAQKKERGVHGDRGIARIQR